MTAPQFSTRIKTRKQTLAVTFKPFQFFDSHFFHFTFRADPLIDVIHFGFAFLTCLSFHFHFPDIFLCLGSDPELDTRFLTNRENGNIQIHRLLGNQCLRKSFSVLRDESFVSTRLRDDSPSASRMVFARTAYAPNFGVPFLVVPSRRSSGFQRRILRHST